MVLKFCLFQCLQQSASASEDDKSAQQALKRQFARQQAKDLAERTKQIHLKDMELESLRQQLCKVNKGIFIASQCVIAQIMLLSDDAIFYH